MATEPAPQDQRDAARVVAVLGSGTSVAQRLTARLAADPSVVPRTVGATELAGGVAELAGDAALSGAGALFVVGPAVGPDLMGTGGAALDLDTIRRAIDAASRHGITHVVALSSAMVYGGWANNPVPLTEDAPLRPDPSLPLAVHCAELERLLGDWAAERDDRTVAVLRPVVTVSGERAAWLRRSPWVRNRVRLGDADPPRQFVHVDDVVDALVVAWRERLDGAFNVAPDGWLAPDAFRELEGPLPRITLGPALGAAFASWRRRAGLDGGADLLPFTTQPWVVANDRLRRAGWRPSHTNEEAFVEADAAGPLRSLSPRARQELSLVALGATVAAAVVATVLVVLRRRRRG